MRRFVFILLFLFPGLARAEGTEPFEFKGMLELSGGYHFTSPAVDGVANATYEKKFVSGFEGTIHLGAVVGPFYLGAAYEYWSAGRKFTEGGTTRTDVLNYSSVGGEVGLLFHSNPRVYWMLTGTAYYSLKSEISSSVTGAAAVVFTAPKKLTYQGRAALGFKLARRLSGLFEGGYRLGNLGSFTNGGNALPSSGGELDLSGAFAGVGLAVHF